jgi:hypothetical protein
MHSHSWGGRGRRGGFAHGRSWWRKDDHTSSPASPCSASATPSNHFSSSSPCTSNSLPRVRHIKDVSLTDRCIIRPGNSTIKTWLIGNPGPSEWPQHTLLAYVKGHRELIDMNTVQQMNHNTSVECLLNMEAISASSTNNNESSCLPLISVPRAGVGEEIEISIPLVVPDITGRYTTFFRLFDADQKKPFGPRFWVDIIAQHESETQQNSTTSSTDNNSH